ncbi:MAG TPA: helix-hairpin-helix domain-containing protein [Limnochordia bacterium]
MHFSRVEQWLVFVFASVIAVGTAGRWLLTARAVPLLRPAPVEAKGSEVPATPPPEPVLEPPPTLDLNGATRDELVSLPGIGPALAERIVAYREAHGPFDDLSALLAVRGIGPATLRKLAPHVHVTAGAGPAGSGGAQPPGDGAGTAPREGSDCSPSVDGR